MSFDIFNVVRIVFQIGGLRSVNQILKAFCTALQYQDKLCYNNHLKVSIAVRHPNYNNRIISAVSHFLGHPVPLRMRYFKAIVVEYDILS